jgi:16S rRNA (uracil1498-N3)-methyltransferase
MAMRFFFIEQPAAAGSTALITGSDARHIKTVLRLKPGDFVGLFDGQGYEYEAQIRSVSSNRIEVAVIRGAPAQTESSVEITVAQAYLKEKKMDDLVRQLSEIGINRWIPFFAKRSIPRPDKKHLAARTNRWAKIAREALKQCRRGRLLDIGEAVSFEAVLEMSHAYDLNIVFWEEATQPANNTVLKAGRPIKKILVLLGPEGGFGIEEIEKASQKGFVTAALGPRILRAETATLAACVLLQYLYGDLGDRPRKIS